MLRRPPPRAAASAHPGSGTTTLRLRWLATTCHGEGLARSSAPGYGTRPSRCPHPLRHRMACRASHRSRAGRHSPPIPVRLVLSASHVLLIDRLIWGFGRAVSAAARPLCRLESTRVRADTQVSVGDTYGQANGQTWRSRSRVSWQWMCQECRVRTKAWRRRGRTPSSRPGGTTGTTAQGRGRSRSSSSTVCPRSPSALYDVMPRRLWMISADVGFAPASPIPLSIRSAPSQASAMP